MTNDKQPAAEELKPCPFCGGKSYIVTQNLFGELVNWVQCKNNDCGACAQLEAWDRRAAPALSVPADEWNLSNVIEALMHQGQCDEDGVMCSVSRQAVEEAITILKSLAAPIVQAEGQNHSVHQDKPLAEPPVQTGECESVPVDKVRLYEGVTALLKDVMQKAQENATDYKIHPSENARRVTWLDAVLKTAAAQLMSAFDAAYTGMDAGQDRKPNEKNGVVSPLLLKQEDKYNELIMAVGMKHHGETRHQTALRYIQQAERGSNNEMAQFVHPKGQEQ